MAIQKPRDKSSFVLAFMMLFAACAFSQTRQSPVAKQEVPDNPSAPAAPTQPIPYSHKTHLALGLKCEFCHVNPAPGALMTFPSTDKCMTCHADVATDKPAIQKLAQFDASKTSIPWVRVYTLRSGLHWSHRVHLEAGKTCVACHGDVAQLDRMAEVTSVTTMFSCLSCHQKNSAKTNCSTCHQWP